MAIKMFPESISKTEQTELEKNAALCRGAILGMTSLAASGHPGGSMSSIDILLALYKYANISPKNINDKNRDRIVVSIGHISPAVYSALAVSGFFPMDKAISEFRLAGSIFEGHIERTVSGVEWTTGNLGQGLSAACGIAMACKIEGTDCNIYTIMGDGEQQKGQISEARRFASKYRLSNLIVFIDCNGLQISGKTDSIMPQDLAAEYKADGWEVLFINGHDFEDIASAVHSAQKSGKPSVILAKTVMGKGVSFMENQHKYHGSALSGDDYAKAMTELGLTPKLDKYKELRAGFKAEKHTFPRPTVKTAVTSRRYYDANADTDCRSSFGAAITDIVKASLQNNNTPVAVFDCDLASSVKTNGVEKEYPDNFIQSGISEHNTATAAGAASIQGIIPFYTGFTMFAIDEVYNQLRMNDINDSNLKVVSTHAGVDVGEDGRTHQCIDYLGLMRNLFGFSIIAPADPNQTDSAVRYAYERYGNFHIVMGRSKVPVITDESGKPLYGEGYTFRYGFIEKVRGGKTPLISYGGMLHRALKVRELAGNDLAVYNAPTPTCIDKNQIKELAKAGIIFTLEDHNPSSGLYATICEIIASEGIACKVVPFGVKEYSYSGKPDALYKMLSLDPESVAKEIKARI